MKNETLELGALRSGLFRLVWRGWFAGVLVIFIPIWLLALIVLALQGNWRALVPAAGLLILMPVIAAVQGVMFSGLVWLGLTVWPPRQSREQD